ncbi:MAG: hypothetical protein ACLFT2_07040 [Candidatus Brocadiia bacterium]
MGLIDEKISKWRYRRILDKVNGLEKQMRDLADEQFPEKYIDLRRRRRKGASHGDLMPEMFALVREACRRGIGIRPYDVQVRAACALAEGRIAEMKTGEGKTFVAPLAAALYALDKNGVHVLTANDYLAGRDQQKLDPVYRLLGLSSGCVLADTPSRDRAQAYRQDITFTTVTQLGFDFLREYFQQDPEQLRRHNMWHYMRSEIDGTTRENRCLRGRYCAIMDEVDSILVDYARRPLSLSTEAEIQRPPEMYEVVRSFALESLQDGRDYTVDRVERTVELTDQGKKNLSPLKDQYGYFHLLEAEWEERVEEAIKAEYLYHKGTHYVVKDGQVVLIDETSGRLKIGQHLGGELHQAVEAKEGLPVRPRQEVAKKVTIQSLIRPYDHLAGMTGTAWEARREFRSVYSMKTVRYRPRIPDQTEFLDDLIFVDSDRRWEEVANQVQEVHDTGRAVLVGTRSVDASERVSEMIGQKGIEHDVLNAVNHSEEAKVIAKAGQVGQVTVATNMAGRGVEIEIADEVNDRGGLHVLGTERHTLHRMDRQLAGRTGRRGQPGSVQFCGALEDDVFQAISDRKRDKLQRKYNRNGQLLKPRKGYKLARKAQSRFSQYHASVRKKLLAQDIAQEEGDKILFGQDKL